MLGTIISFISNNGSTITGILTAVFGAIATIDHILAQNKNVQSNSTLQLIGVLPKTNNAPTPGQ